MANGTMNECIRLITVSRTLVNGHYQETETALDVFAEVKSVTRSEFYQSYAAGLRADAIFRVYTEEIGGAAYVEYAGKRYKVTRAYRTDSLCTELTCAELQGGVAGGGV